MFNFLKKVIILLTILLIIAETLIITVISKYAELIYSKFQEPVPTYLQPVLFIALILIALFTIAISIVACMYLSEQINKKSDEYLDYLKFKEYLKQNKGDF